MAKIKLLLLALLFIAIPKGLYAYTTGQIVTFNHMTYKVTSSTLRTLAFLGPDESIVGLLEIPGTVGDNKGTTFTVTRVSFVNPYHETSAKLIVQNLLISSYFCTFIV